MLKMLGAAVAAVSMLAAGSASAATHVIDFEGYNVGDTINGFVLGTPYQVLRLRGEIVAGPTGNALKILPQPDRHSASFELRSQFTGNYADPENEAGLIIYEPALLSFDYFAPLAGAIEFEWPHANQFLALSGGAWSSLSPNYPVTDMTWRAFTDVPYLLVDNMAFEEGYGVVPEPATWAMMIIGFGLTGAALRRRWKPALDIGRAVVP